MLPVLAYQYIATKRPLSCGEKSGFFGDNRALADADGNLANNCRKLPIWSARSWTQYLINHELERCVYTGVERETLDLELDLNDSTKRLSVKSIVLVGTKTTSNSKISILNPETGLYEEKLTGNGNAFNIYGAYGGGLSQENLTYNLNDHYYMYLVNGNQESIQYYTYHGNHCVNDNPIMPLQTDAQKLKNKINNLQITNADATYTDTGIYWGWQLLSPNKPFDAAGEYDKDHKKIMVIISDGTNSGYVDYMVKLCDKIKNYQYDASKKIGGVEIYTVGFDVSANEHKQCATDDDHYYDATGNTVLKDLLDISGKINGGDKVALVK
jgi:hypothetical protein